MVSNLTIYILFLNGGIDIIINLVFDTVVIRIIEFFFIV